MTLIDTHCHLDLPAFDADRERVLQHCRDLGISDILVPAIRAAGWERLFDLCAAVAELHPAVGLHPMFMDQHCDDDLTALGQALADRQVVAVGEIGLDFQQPEADREAQTALFDAQLGLAAAHRLPVVLHVRKAHDQVLQSLRHHRPPGGIAHAFNGSLQQARAYIELGFGLGFGGMLTYPRSTRLRALARDLPLDALVLETDAPDMVVSAHRGQRNSPEYLPDIVAALAEVRGLPIGRVAAATSANARRILSIRQAA